MDDMKTTKPNNNYFNIINKLFKDKYVISGATHFNQYLGIKLINNKKNNILLIQQQKIEYRFKNLRLKNCNIVKTLIKGYL